MAVADLKASQLIEQWIASGVLSRSVAEAIFASVPTDFTLRIRPRLPLFAHRSGAVAITLCGDVTALRPAWEGMPPTTQCALLRHEAEHVRQQRAAPLLFYLRYGLAWVWGFMTVPGGRGTRGHRAYRSIPYEVDAYAAEAEAARRLAER